MIKICWISDTHLDVPSLAVRNAFYKEIAQTQADTIILTGDIADGLTVSDRLIELLNYCDKTIYFVLGNHDYFHRDVGSVRHEIKELCQSYPQLIWMNDVNPVKLDDKVALLGIDSWADGRHGDYQNSRLGLLDSRYIADYVAAAKEGREKLLETMQYYADKDALLLERKLQQAKTYEKIMVLLHVPPFPESSWHQGKPSCIDALPYFSSKVTGDVLLSFAEQYSNIQLHVYCGHSHCYRRYQASPNLLIETAAAKTGEPAISGLISIICFQ